MSLYSDVLFTPVPPAFSSSLTLSSTPFAGRSLFATEALTEAHLLHKSGPPFARSVLDSYRKEVCQTCFAQSTKSTPPLSSWDVFEEGDAGSVQKRGVRWFCSDECRQVWRDDMGLIGREAVRNLEGAISLARRNGKRVSDGIEEGEAEIDVVEKMWREAKESEDDREGLREEDDVDVIRFLLDGLIGFANLEEDSNGETTSRRPTWEALTSLVPSFMPYESPSSGLYSLYSHIRMYHTLERSLPITLLPFLTPLSILTLLTRDASNSFGVWDGVALLAYAVFPSASYFNHSCSPNIVKVIKDAEWTFTTKGTILLGEELCISYLGGGEVEVGTLRREKLKDGWGFDCRCPRCFAELELAGANEEGV